MPNIDNIKQFKKDILDDLANERIKKEPFGIKMEVAPPFQGEVIVPWEEENNVLNEDFMNNKTENSVDEKSFDLDSILESLDDVDEKDSYENALVQTEDENVIGSGMPSLDLGSEFENLNEEFNLENDAVLDANIEKTLNENSISLDEAKKLNLDNKIDTDTNDFPSPNMDGVFEGSNDLGKDIPIVDNLNVDLENNSFSAKSSPPLEDFSRETSKADSISDLDKFNLDDLIESSSVPGESSEKLDDLLGNSLNLDNFGMDNNLDKGSSDEVRDFSNFSDDFNFLEDEVKKTSESEIKVNYPLFLRNLSSYSRNLRVAIAEALTKDGIPKYKLEALIDLVEQNKKGLKYISKFTGDIVGRSIKLPVIYFKAEEFEKLQQNLSYRIKKAIIPIIKIASSFMILITITFYFLVNVVFFYVASEQKYREGIAYIYENKRELAKSTFKDAYFMRPNNKWFITYAKVFEEVRDFDSAEEKYEELFTINPFAKNSIDRRRKNFDRNGYVSFSKMKMRLGEYDKANKILDEVISNNLYDYDGLMAKGDNYLKWAKIDPQYYKESISQYTILLSKYGQSKEILFKLFNSYIEADAETEANNVNSFIKSDEAMDIDTEVYTKYVKKLIDKYIDFKVYNKRANNLSRDLRYLDGQINLLNKEFPNLKTDNDRTIMNTLNNINMNSEIEYILRRILTKNPNYDKALFESGRYFYQIGDVKKAEGYLLTALSSFRNLGSVDNYKDKIVTYKILADIYGKDNDSLKASNIISLALNDYDFYKKHNLVSASKEVSSVYDKQGDILESLNDYRSAINAYEMAINEGVDYPDIYYKVAILNYKENNYKNSLTHLFKVENMAGYSNSNDLLYSIGSVLYKMNDLASSRSYYMRMVENLQREKLSISNFRPKENEYHKLLLTNEIEVLNNLGVIEVKISDGPSRNNELFSTGVSNLTESARMFDVLNRDDDMVKSVKKDLASLNLRNIWDNKFRGDGVLVYENLPEKL